MKFSRLNQLALLALLVTVPVPETGLANQKANRRNAAGQVIAAIQEKATRLPAAKRRQIRKKVDAAQSIEELLRIYNQIH